MTKKITLRVNGTRVGEVARPAEDTPQRLPTRRVVASAGFAGARSAANAARRSIDPRNALVIRDYRDDENEAG